LGFEAANIFSRYQMRRALSMESVAEARQLIDSIRFNSPRPERLGIHDSTMSSVKGVWLEPDSRKDDRTILYFHGGGYAFFAKAHINMIGHIACAAKARTFALDYKLAPEHSYPAQLEDAYAAYKALLDSKWEPRNLILAGDSAGGHLVLSLVDRLRQSNTALPTLAVCLCPWTEVGGSTSALYDNDHYDWVQGAQTQQFARWLIGSASIDAQSISPMDFDVTGFPPLYVQAGGCEALFDMIVRFAQRVADAGGEITLDVWPEMTHDFQAYGEFLQESKQALARIGDVVEHYLGDSRETQMPASQNTLLQCHRPLSHHCTQATCSAAQDRRAHLPFDPTSHYTKGLTK
jgi:acetyl esterase/lipase